MTTHASCAVCTKPVCPWDRDGTLPTGHAECAEDNGTIFGKPGEFESVHDHCRIDYMTRAIAKEVRAGLELRHGYELNSIVIGERSANVAIRVYVLLRSLGVVRQEKIR